MINNRQTAFINTSVIYYVVCGFSIRELLSEIIFDWSEPPSRNVKSVQNTGRIIFLLNEGV